jgi:hypothetical protein
MYSYNSHTTSRFTLPKIGPRPAAPVMYRHGCSASDRIATSLRNIPAPSWLDVQGSSERPVRGAAPDSPSTDRQKVPLMTYSATSPLEPRGTVTGRLRAVSDPSAST